MTWMDIAIPVLTLIVGLAAGFFIGIFYVRKQMENMQKDPQMLQKMAKQMGMNVNRQQMQQMQKMMNKQKFK